MKIYYAHHQWKYGTKIEDFEIGLIRKAFPDAEIVNPNGDIPHHSAYECDIMEDCLRSVLGCDTIVFSSLSGVIGKGVCEEVIFAKSQSKRLLYLYGTRLIDAENVLFNRISGNDSNRIYAFVEIGGR